MKGMIHTAGVQGERKFLFEDLPKSATQLYAALSPGNKVHHARSPRLTTPSHSITQGWLSGDSSKIYY